MPANNLFHNGKNFFRGLGRSQRYLPLAPVTLQRLSCHYLQCPRCRGTSDARVHMSFDSQQELLLQVFASISGACSACGSGYVIWKIAAASPEERGSLSSRMLLVLSLMDFFAAIFFGVGVSGRRNDAFCVFQGFMIEWFALGGVIWNSCMAWNIYKWIVLRKHPDRIIRKLKYYIAASVLIPFTISLALAIGAWFCVVSCVTCALLCCVRDG